MKDFEIILNAVMDSCGTEDNNSNMEGVEVDDNEY